ncbi:MAG: ABC transporter ATP-binding protein [Isosphaeraceae bacterium]|nr:ABC transporter ATP-binding protein [Isosphaeraceae bacterium]
MKNFARLARFAWPYRVRFGLSLGCAVMVALLYFTDIMAVYPLLQILFKSQNAQKWIAEQIEVIETQIRSLALQRDEVRRIEAHTARDDLRNPDLLRHFIAIREDHERKLKRFLDRQREFDILVPDADAPRDPSLLVPLRREEQVAKARLDELRDARDLAMRRDLAGLARRREALDKQLASKQTWLARYRRLQPLVNRYLPDDGFRTLVLLLGLVLLGIAIKGLFLFSQEVLVADTVQLSLFDIRNLFYRRTMALDLASFGDQGSAELMARFTSDIDSLSQGLNTLLSKMVREPLRVLTCLGGALWFNWRLTLLALILVPVSAATTIRAGKIMKRAVRRSLESMSTIYKILQETFQGIKVVKAFAAERRERRRFFLETKALYKKSLRVARIDALSDPVLEMLALLTVMIALLAGSYLVLHHETFLHLGFGLKLQLASQPPAIEDLLTLYAMLASMADPIRKLANVHSKLQRAAAASDRICALMDRRPTVADRPGAIRLPRHRKAIEFDQIVFGYDPHRPVLRNLSLSVRHGEAIALVGPNGCGKSTLLSLLPRFYDVQAGAIRIDGHDLRDIQIRSLRTQIGMVTQETILFEGTLADNIAYGNRHASRAEIEAAAKRAYAHGFISALPDGYDTVIGERGLSLSGGQRQRIALARAMLCDPAILLLDEATSAVDIQDEALIRKAIEEFARGRTTFLITHSLGSLQFADRIVLMNDGQIEAVGTEAELRRSSALYRRLYEIHFQRESA